MEKTTFIFDFFGVICAPVIGGWYKDYSKKHNFEDPNQKNILREFDLGRVTRDELFDYFLQYEHMDLTKSELEKEIESYMKVDHRMVRLIQDLKKKGFKIALLSNAGDGYFEKIMFPRHPEIKDLFDAMVMSYSVHMAKPDAEIYLHTLKEIGSTPEESIFIDDNKANIRGAEAVGIHSFLFQDFDEFVAYLSKMGIVN